jgi:hypothetical protein
MRKEGKRTDLKDLVFQKSLWRTTCPFLDYRRPVTRVSRLRPFLVSHGGCERNHGTTAAAAVAVAVADKEEEGQEGEAKGRDLAILIRSRSVLGEVDTCRLQFRRFDRRPSL